MPSIVLKVPCGQAATAEGLRRCRKADVWLRELMVMSVFNGRSASAIAVVLQVHNMSADAQNFKTGNWALSKPAILKGQDSR